MATYKSDAIEIDAPAEKVFSKMSNLENLKALLAQAPANAIPEEQLQQLEQIKMTADTIELPAGPVGSLVLRVTERREPTLVRLAGEGSPVPLHLDFVITPKSDERCLGQAVLDLDIPMMLRPMVNGPLNKMVGQFGQLMKHINFND